MYRVPLAGALAAALLTSSRGDASGAAPASAAHAPACPAYVGRVFMLDATSQRYAIALLTRGAARTVSGTIALYHRDDRYDVHFTAARAVDPDSAAETPSPVVVRLTEPAPLDGAVITQLDAAEPCEPDDEPWFAGATGATPRIGSMVASTSRLPADETPAPPQTNDALWVRFLSAVPGAEVLAPRPAVHEPPVTCEKPTESANTLRAAAPGSPPPATLAPGQSVRVDVLVTIRADGTVERTKVLHSSGSAALDGTVSDIAAKATYAPATFRCRHYGGTYLFDARFIR